MVKISGSAILGRMNKRAPFNNQKRQLTLVERARHAEIKATPILFRPTWAEAYASRFRHASNARPRHASPSHPEATSKELNDSTVTFNFTATGPAARSTIAEPDTSAQMGGGQITCPDEAIRRSAFARIMIIRETGAALRAQANISERAARYFFN